MTPSGIETATFRLVAQCLKQLRYQQRAPLYCVWLLIFDVICILCNINQTQYLYIICLNVGFFFEINDLENDLYIRRNFSLFYTRKIYCLNMVTFLVIHILYIIWSYQIRISHTKQRLYYPTRRNTTALHSSVFLTFWHPNFTFKF